MRLKLSLVGVGVALFIVGAAFIVAGMVSAEMFTTGVETPEMRQVLRESSWVKIGLIIMLSAVVPAFLALLLAGWAFVLRDMLRR